MAKVIEKMVESSRLTFDDGPVEQWPIVELEEGVRLLDLSREHGLHSSNLDLIQEGVRVKVGEVFVPVIRLEGGWMVRAFRYEKESPEFGVRGLPSFSPNGDKKRNPTLYPHGDSMRACSERRQEREDELNQGRIINVEGED